MGGVALFVEPDPAALALSALIGNVTAASLAVVVVVILAACSRWE